MPTKSYQHFTIEQTDTGKLTVNKNTNNKVLLIKIIVILIVVFNVFIPFFSKSLGLETVGNSPFVIVMLVIYFSTKNATSKGNLVFDKEKDKFSVNGQKLAILSQMSHVEVNTFVAEEDQLEMYRVCLVSKASKFNIWETKSEKDIRKLANELSQFLGLPIHEMVAKL